MATSAAIHFGYYLTLAQAYRTGDLSFAYPLMRGTAPLIVALLGAAFLRELPSLATALGIMLISIGIVSIAFIGGRRKHPPAAAYWAFANAALIALYTLVDATGAVTPATRRAMSRGSSSSKAFHFSSGSWHAAAGMPCATCATARARPDRRRVQPGRLRHRAVGDDPRTGRGDRRTA